MEELENETGKNLQRIGRIEVLTKYKEFSSFNIIQVEAGTTGFKGGDSGHGCRTYFKIEDMESTDMRCRVISSNGKVYDFSEVCGASQIEIMFGGDTELETFIGALEFAADTLRKQAEYGDTNADIKELKKELNDDVAKMDRLRAKEMAWRIAFFLFAGISAVELLYMYCNRLF